jgi:putative spermidine/putrescine transport system ATP-binding protein
MTFIQVTHAQDEAFSLSDQIVVMDHGHIDQVGTPQEIFVAPASQFVAKFVGDNNIFTGKVINAIADTKGHVIQLEVPGIGILLCRGEFAQPGDVAACCVRADRMHLEVASLSDGQMAHNRVSARITFVEFTGYVTRVRLLVESTGAEILYKVRSHDCVSQPLQEGQVVTLNWSTDDCVFLPH